MPTLCGRSYAAAFREKALKFRCTLRDLSDRFPCAAACAGAFSAAWSYVSFPGHLQGAVLSLLCFAAAGILGIRRSLFRFALPVLAACLILEYRSHAGFPVSGRYGAEIVAVLEEPSLCGGKPSWMKNAPGTIHARVLKQRFSGKDEWVPCGGRKLFLHFPPKMLPDAGYGDTVLLKGTFAPIPPPASPGEFDFRRYAENRSVLCIFHASSGKILSSGKGLHRKILDLRGSLLEKFCSRMRTGKQGRELACALLFGMTQGSEQETSEFFLRSGTLHILSVSGMHIGLFFSVFAILFLVVPWKYRWFLLLIPVFFYALSTGMKSPAERAFLMLASWCLLRAGLRTCEPFNAVLAAAAFMMILNPMSVFDTGFEYSFACVGILILSRDFLKQGTNALLASRKYLLKKSRFPVAERILQAGFAAFAASGAAWLVSAGISLCRQGVISFSAVPACILMSPFAWLAFFFFVMAILLFPVPGAAALCGMGAEIPLLLIRRIAGSFADTDFLRIPDLPGWTMGIPFLLTAVLLLTSRKRIAFAASGCLILFLAGALLFPLFRPAETVFFRSSKGGISIVFCKPGGAAAAVFNMPDFETSRMVSDYLKSRGTDFTDDLFLASGRKRDCGGTPDFLRKIRVRSVRFPGKVQRKGKNVRELLFRYPGAETRKGMLAVKEENGEYRIRVLSPLWDYEEIIFRKDRAVLKRNGRKTEEIMLPFSNTGQVRIFR